MKKPFSILLMILITVIVNFSNWAVSAPAANDGQNIPVELGFNRLSAQDLDSGYVLLFDGRSFFGWEAEPVSPVRSANVPDPVIMIKNGEMVIKTEIPLKLRTPIFWKNGPNAADPDLEAIWKKSENTILKCWSLLDAQKNLLVENSFTGQPNWKAGESKEYKFQSAGPVLKEGVRAAWFELTIERGELTIQSLRYRPGGSRDLLADLKTFWKEPAGSMNLKKNDSSVFLSGQGQLETVKTYSDFAAQVKFKTIVDTNRKSETFCNSGLFFRAIPGSKLDGYECQINNDPNDADRFKFLGNDTGGIFRRIAARRITDKDNEPTWLTVTANGLMFRTWVNGIPTVVWNDTRKSDLNPRKGSKTESGTLQIQGHDPWTKIEIFQFRAAD